MLLFLLFGLTQAPANEARSGEQVYKQICAGCHQQEGQGLAGVYPPLAGSEWVNGSPEIPTKIILNGLMGEVTVKGQKYNNVMSPQGMMLSDQEVANVVNYIQSSWGNKSDEKATPELSKKIREEFSGKPMWKPEELK